ncbi:MAG: glycolate oxidase binding subunit [Thermoleophilaceae bacterium]|nr:glycolate oxidase binding subunit [Thermoleophilaceae bacterium]
MVAPASYEEAAEALREAAAGGRRVRVRGAGTKLGWGAPAPDPDVELSTAKLDAVVEHNAGDLTAVVQAGVPLGRLREQLAAAGQMLSIDPPGDGTVGGLFATGDSGPLRHRHSAPRDLALGMTVALSDGTLARSGGKVIKNVAGYDLPKLFTGSLGTLGAILEVAVRLHPLPPRTTTALAASEDPDAVARGASDLAHARSEAQCLDVGWSDGSGRVLARFAGAESAAQAAHAADVLAAAGLTPETLEDDDDLWQRQREGQRSPDGIVLRVSGVQAQLADQLRAAERAGGTLVGRAGYGLSWIALEADRPGAVEDIRRALAPSPCVLLDAPAELRGRVDVWGVGESSAIDLMRRVKRRFDPAGACSPGVMVGGI